MATDIAALEIKAKKDPVHNEAIASRMADLYRVCQYNPSLLVPYYFPKYPYDKPLSLLSRPFSIAMLDFQFGGYTVIRASRQIGKSTTLGVRQLTNASILPKYRSLYVVPHEEHRKTYANRLREMERAFAFPVDSPNHRQNLNYKEYPNGSIIELIRVLSTAAEARGKSSDELILDEAQHMDASLMPELEQVQKASLMPSTIYAGTSLTIDTLLESKWEMSSQGSWHIRADDGKNWINCADPDDALKLIQPEGLTCPYTSRILDPSAGEFVHAKPGLLEAGYKGLHIPQIVIPDFVGKANKWNEIWKAYCEYDRKKFLQEILGIPTTEGAREITEQDLKDICVLPSKEKLYQDAISKKYKYVISGCDWGGSDYNPATRSKLSYTVHAILGVTATGEFHILHLRRYSGMKYQEVINDILKDHQRYGATAMASDFGVGAAYNMLLRESPYINQDQHLILGYVGPKAAPIAPPSGHSWYNQFSVNRTESITQLYTDIRKVDPRIKCFPWEECATYLDDFLNLYRVPVENATTGATEFQYRRHGSKADDSLHAVNFAFILGRLLIGEVLLEDRSLMENLRAKLRGGVMGGSHTGRKIPGVISG